MSSEEGTRLRSGKIIELATISQSFWRMAEQSTVETECVGDSSVSSQIAEKRIAMKRNLANPKQKSDNWRTFWLRWWINPIVQVQTHKSRVLQSSLYSNLTGLLHKRLEFCPVLVNIQFAGRYNEYFDFKYQLFWKTTNSFPETTWTLRERCSSFIIGFWIQTILWNFVVTNKNSPSLLTGNIEGQRFWKKTLVLDTSF